MKVPTKPRMKRSVEASLLENSFMKQKGYLSECVNCFNIAKCTTDLLPVRSGFSEQVGVQNGWIPSVGRMLFGAYFVIFGHFYLIFDPL